MEHTLHQMIRGAFLRLHLQRYSLDNERKKLNLSSTYSFEQIARLHTVVLWVSLEAAINWPPFSVTWASENEGKSKYLTEEQTFSIHIFLRNWLSNQLQRSEKGAGKTRVAEDSRGMRGDAEEGKHANTRWAVRRQYTWQEIMFITAHFHIRCKWY